MKIKRTEIACLVLFVSLVSIFLTHFSAKGFVANLSPSPTINEVESGSNFGTPAINKYIWYSTSNNAGEGNLPDFLDIFSEDESKLSQWTYSRQRTSVFFMRNNTLRDLQVSNPNFFQDELVPFLERNNFDLALNLTGATWASCKSPAQHDNGFQRDRDLIADIEVAGGSVQFVAMQSVLSKPVPIDPNHPAFGCNGGNPELPSQEYTLAMRERYL